MKKSILFTLFLVTIASSGNVAQSFDGYVITKTGEKLEGFLRFDQHHREKGYQIKLYQSKKSLDPLIFYTFEVDEYAYKKDTIKILKNFYPYREDNLHIKQVEVKIHSRGKVMLYEMEEKILLPGFGATVQGMGLSIGGTIKNTIFLLEDHIGYKAGIKKDNYKESLLDFFRECSKCKYFINGRKFKYKDIPELVRRVNAGEL